MATEEFGELAKISTTITDCCSALLISLLALLAGCTSGEPMHCEGLAFIEVMDPSDRTNLVRILEREKVQHLEIESGVCYDFASAEDMRDYLVELHRINSPIGRMVVKFPSVASAIVAELNAQKIEYRTWAVEDGIAIEVDASDASRLEEISRVASKRFVDGLNRSTPN